VLGDIKVGSGSELGPELKQAFDWVLGAYLVFDVKHTGILDKEEVLKQMQAKEGAFKSAGAASVLSAERWKEMDWDDDGTITFKEFFWAFQGWISAEDEDA
jgi:calcium-binding protein CML